MQRISISLPLDHSTVFFSSLIRKTTSFVRIVMNLNHKARFFLSHPQMRRRRRKGTAMKEASSQVEESQGGHCAHSQIRSAGGQATEIDR